MANKPTPPQTAQVALNLENATPDTADQAARGADSEKQQKYLPVIFPLRQGRFRVGAVKSDFIKLFNIDTNASTTSASIPASVSVDTSKRDETVSAGDDSPQSTTVGKTVKGKGTRAELPRGKTVRVPLGKATSKGNMRYGHIRVPSSMSSIEIAHWIKTCFRTNPPQNFQVGHTRYVTESLAKEIGKLPLTKSMKQGE